LRSFFDPVRRFSNRQQLSRSAATQGAPPIQYRSICAAPNAAAADHPGPSSARTSVLHRGSLQAAQVGEHHLAAQFPDKDAKELRLPYESLMLHLQSPWSRSGDENGSLHDEMRFSPITINLAH